MADFKKKLLAVLDEIKGSGSFVSNNSKPFLFPGLAIKGVGEIGFPINSAQVKEMIKVARKARFGKGSETVLDTAVRSAWEIDADQVEFKNKDWGKFVDDILKEIKPGLGIESYSITANLYKLLIYEKGDFFVAHKDSEKEKGMFGTLIIGLPSTHTGGELSVRFDGKEKIIDFTGSINQYKIPFTAFYADCEHEIKPITSGHRVCLVYNLVQNKGNVKIEINPLGSYVEKLAAILKNCEEDGGHPKIVLLGHQYTPANFTTEALKLNDRPKAEALIKAAGKVGFYFKMGLVTSYQIGSLEIQNSKSSRNNRRGYYYDEDNYDNAELAANGAMGEVYDEGIRIEHWMDEGLPSLGNIEFKEENLVAAITLNEGDPIEKIAEGYTGNAGMEMEYWYHYGAVFLWPKKYHYNILANLSTVNKLEWIGYYNQHWHSLTTVDIEMTKKLVGAGLQLTNSGRNIDFTPLVDWLINLNDRDYLSEKSTSDFLMDYFKLITIEGWVKLFLKYPCNYFENIFTTVARKREAAIINHILVILNNLKAGPYQTFILDQIQPMPAYINLLRLSDQVDKITAKKILRNILELADLKAMDNVWLNNTTGAFTRELTREYVNNVLIAEIMSFGKKTILAKQIIAVGKEDLMRRVNNKPLPPTNWTRQVPIATSYKKVWALLTDFLQSPTLQVFDYAKAQAQRSEIENAILNVTIDLKTETIKKGSPHTLRLIKTQDAYEKDFANWKTDVTLLKKLETW